MRRLPPAAVALALTGLTAAPAAAQYWSSIAFRPFVMAGRQQFAARTTFESVFGERTQTFVGGGLEITQDDRYYLALSASRFEKTGQRAFLFDGRTFRLGIPLTAAITPLEATAGYRFHLGRRVRPYVGGGAGLYHYTETSDLAASGETVDTRHAGAVAEAGVEVRLHRWFGVAADVRYTHVPGVLGAGGISKDAGEKDLGGVAGRVRVVVGR